MGDQHNNVTFDSQRVRDTGEDSQSIHRRLSPLHGEASHGAWRRNYRADSPHAQPRKASRGKKKPEETGNVLPLAQTVGKVGAAVRVVRRGANETVQRGVAKIIAETKFDGAQFQA